MTVFCVYAIVHLLYIIYLSLYNFFCVFKVDVKKIIHIQKYIFKYFLNVAAAFFMVKFWQPQLLFLHELNIYSTFTTLWAHFIANNRILQFNSVLYRLSERVTVTKKRSEGSVMLQMQSSPNNSPLCLSLWVCARCPGSEGGRLQRGQSGLPRCTNVPVNSNAEHSWIVHPCWDWHSSETQLKPAYGMPRKRINKCTAALYNHSPARVTYVTWWWVHEDIKSSTSAPRPD